MSWLIEFVKEKEGFRGLAYQDSAGIWTVGYGSTLGVTSMSTTTKEAAEWRLVKELMDYLDFVINYGKDYGYDWNKKQVGALTSFIYNLGKGALRQVTDSGTRDNATIAKKMKLYYNAGGKKLPGLVKRRLEESARFSS